MVENEQNRTSYNRNQVAEMLKNLDKYPDRILVGFDFKGPSAHKSYESELGAFAVLRMTNKKLHVELFFTAAGDRNRGWSSIISNWVAEQNRKNGILDSTVNFIPNNYIGSQWIEKYLVTQLMERAHANLESYLENGQVKADNRIIYEQIKLVQGLNFTYEDVPNLSMEPQISQEQLCREQVSREKNYASQKSPFEPHERKPALIIFVGELGVGKNKVFDGMKASFPWLLKFEMLDIDAFAEETIRTHLSNGGTLSENVLKTIYDEAWEKFVVRRDDLIAQGKNIVLFVTGRQHDLVPTYRALTQDRYRITTANIFVSDRKLLESRRSAREKAIGRPVPEYFAQKCEAEVPPAIFAHNNLYEAANVNIFNDGDQQNPIPPYFASMTCNSGANCDDEWRQKIGEPTHFLRIYLNEETKARLSIEYKALVFGYNTKWTKSRM